MSHFGWGPQPWCAAGHSCFYTGLPPPRTRPDIHHEENQRGRLANGRVTYLFYQATRLPGSGEIDSEYDLHSGYERGLATPRSRPARKGLLNANLIAFLHHRLRFYYIDITLAQANAFHNMGNLRADQGHCLT